MLHKTIGIMDFSFPKIPSLWPTGGQSTTTKNTIQTPSQ
jgi:hypothetical protein